MNADLELDVTGLLCPMPVIKLQQALMKLEQQQIIQVICSDPGTEHDIPAWCRVNGHELVDQNAEERLFTFWVKKS